MNSICSYESIRIASAANSAVRAGSPIPGASLRHRSPMGDGSPPRKKPRGAHTGSGRISHIVLPTYEEGDEEEDESPVIDEESYKDEENAGR